MTAFSPTNIPSNVSTIEELLVWAASALAEINPNVGIDTSPSLNEPVVTAQTFRFANQATNPERFVVVAYLPLAGNWRSVGKPWSNGILEISAAALPALYTTN